jgi:hypothetical protein
MFICCVPTYRHIIGKNVNAREQNAHAVVSTVILPTTQMAPDKQRTSTSKEQIVKTPVVTLEVTASSESFVSEPPTGVQ